MNYWAIINNVKVGPLSAEQLIACGATAQTPVWCEGMAQWAAAATVPELAPLFVPKPSWTDYSTPNPAPAPMPTPTEPMPPCPQTYLVWAILTTVLCCWPLGIPAIVYAAKVSTRYNQGDYAGAKQASERAAMWTIISIVAGLVSTPFCIAML